MTNEDPQLKEDSTEPIWRWMPLFRREVLRLEVNNAVPLTSGEDVQQMPETQRQMNSDEISDGEIEDSISSDPKVVQTENVDPPILEGIEATAEQISDAVISRTIASQKRSSQKRINKKTKSQKRLVVTAKFFVTPEEKRYLQSTATNCSKSFSNLVRSHLGLNQNDRGRRKQNIEAAFDLGLDDPKG